MQNIWHITNLSTDKPELYKSLTTFIKENTLVASTVRNKWIKAKNENQNFIVVGIFRIKQIKLK